MAINVIVPELGDSVLEATVIRWVKQEGDFVKLGETIVELETEKANFEVAAKTSGLLSKILKKAEEDVEVGNVLGEIEPSDEQSAGKKSSPPQAAEKPSEKQDTSITEISAEKTKTAEETETAEETKGPEVKATPVAQNVARQNEVDLSEVEGTGVGNKIMKEDVESHLGSREKTAAPEHKDISDLFPSIAKINSDREKRVRMSRRRRTIARRLKEAQETAAILSTFNEVDMYNVMDLRKRKKEEFREKHDISLGFSGFFVKACIAALKEFPQLNAEIQNEEIVFKNYYDIGIAIGADEGLVVPVLRDADRKSMAEIERTVKDFAVRSGEGKLSLDDLIGGTFSITNGGVFGSLMSTPIINPPQVGILGLHKIEERPVVKDGEITVRPMMYTALSYDHRIVDGKEAVQFLVRIKELIEDPESLLIEG